jgi:hypothetical protein
MNVVVEVMKVMKCIKRLFGGWMRCNQIKKGETTYQEMGLGLSEHQERRRFGMLDIKSRFIFSSNFSL